MILAQKFKTLAGAMKRCAFENAHRHERYGNANVTYYVRTFYSGAVVPFGQPVGREALASGKLHWQIEKRPNK
jgi:hypothetical protein